MNETIRILLSRRSVRKYTNEPVEAAQIEEILACGVHAPSGKNRQEINLTAVADPQRIEAIRAIVQAEFAKMEPDEKNASNAAVLKARASEAYDFAFGAPVVVIASGPAGWRNGMADSALALANVLTAASSLGLGSCYVNQLHWLSGNEPLRAYLATLGLEREDEIYGTVVLGHSAEAPRPAPPRRDGRIRIIR